MPDIDDPMFDGLVGLQMSVTVDRQDDETGELVRAWFEQAWRNLGGVLREVADRGFRATTDDLTRGVETRGTIAGPDDAEWQFDYDQASWGEFLNRVGVATWSSAFVVSAERLSNDSGAPYAMTQYYFWVAASRQSFLGSEVLTLQVQSKYEFLFGPPERGVAVLGFLKDAVRSADVDYADVGFGYGGISTLIEAATYRYWVESVGKARQTLRGYSWVTVVPKPLVSALGGVAVLKRSGAFFSVEELPSGAVWLQATEHFDDYQDPQAGRVFEVLKPVLPPGAMASAFRRKIDFLRLRA